MFSVNLFEQQRQLFAYLVEKDQDNDWLRPVVDISEMAGLKDCADNTFCSNRLVTEEKILTAHD